MYSPISVYAQMDSLYEHCCSHRQLFYFARTFLLVLSFEIFVFYFFRKSVLSSRQFFFLIVHIFPETHRTKKITILFRRNFGSFAKVIQTSLRKNKLQDVNDHHCILLLINKDLAVLLYFLYCNIHIAENIGMFVALWRTVYILMNTKKKEFRC